MKNLFVLSVLFVLSAISAPGSTNLPFSTRSVTADTNGNVTWPVVLSVSNLVLGTDTVIPINRGGTGNTTNRAATAQLATIANACTFGSFNLSAAPVSWNGSNNIFSPAVFKTSAGNYSYTENGLIGSNANPSRIELPSSSQIRFGYLNAGGGAYPPRIGMFDSYDTTNNSVDFGVSDYSFTGFSVSIGGVVKLSVANDGTISANNIYLTNNCSALTFTDRSDAPANSAAAVRMIASYAVKDGKVDHAKLDPGLWGSRDVDVLTGEKQTNVVAAVLGANDVVLRPRETNVVSVTKTVMIPDQSKRNLSMSVSALMDNQQQLMKQIAELIERVTVLENPGAVKK